MYWTALKIAVASEVWNAVDALGLLVQFFRLGLDGNACTLRLLCEVVERPLKNAGLLGDIINLVLRYFSNDPEKKLYLNICLRGDPRGGEGRRTDDYIGAQNLGKAGNCTSLYKHCPLSLFNFSMFNK